MELQNALNMLRTDYLKNIPTLKPRDELGKPMQCIYTLK